MFLFDITLEQYIFNDHGGIKGIHFAYCFLFWLLFNPQLKAETLSLPPNSSDSVVGELTFIRSREEETLIDIAREFDLGHDQIILANPGVNRWMPGRSLILIPSLYILPAVKKGIVIDSAALRLFYYPENNSKLSGVVITFPISIGRMDWKTPLGITKVVSKEINPAWYPPDSLKAESQSEGYELPDFIPGGAIDNPLGRHALKLARPGYLIHGTDQRRSFGIGMRVTHGCIRLYPEDMEKLFPLVKINTSVNILDQPVRTGWFNKRLYLAIHRKSNSDYGDQSSYPDFSEVLDKVDAESGYGVRLDFDKIRKAYRDSNGIPVVIGEREEEIAELRE